MHETLHNDFSFPTLMSTSLKSLAAKATVAGVSSFVFVSSALAQSFAGPDPDLPGIPSATNPEDVRGVITNILSAILNFLALIAVVIIVIAGIRLIISQGEDEQKDKAKKTIFYALGGLIIVLFARVIVSIVTVYLANQI